MSNPYRGTTPTIQFHITKPTNFDCAIISEPYITLRNKVSGKQKTFTASIDVENKILSISLTQEDTLFFNEGELKVQGKFLLRNGKVIPSKVIEGTLEEILDETILGG